MVKTREERCIEWLERLEIPVEDTTTIERLQTYLKDEFDITKPTQIDALWKTSTRKYEEFAPRGVKPLTIKYPWGTQLRFGVKGFPGLWGLATVKARWLG